VVGLGWFQLPAAAAGRRHCSFTDVIDLLFYSSLSLASLRATCGAPGCTGRLSVRLSVVCPSHNCLPSMQNSWPGRTSAGRPPPDCTFTFLQRGAKETGRIIVPIADDESTKMSLRSCPQLRQMLTIFKILSSRYR